MSGRRPLDPLTYALAAAAQAGAGAGPVRLGTVTATGVKVGVRFDGESAASQRLYSRLTSYTPAVGDRVVLVQVGGTWVALGALAA